tara:strand:- start:2193 stop:2726 length:534 start_codon:yes stop_codon:yes gene_type:complete
MNPFAPSNHFSKLPGDDVAVQEQKMNNDTFRKLFKENAQYAQSILMRTPKIWGDPNRVKGNFTVHVNDLLINTRSGDVIIGKNCFFGHGCALLTGSHDPMKFGKERLNDVPSHGHDIIVDDGVWLASFVTVIGPAILGKDSVAAAGSLIIGDMKPGWLYAGTPAKPIKNLKAKEDSQ